MHETKRVSYEYMVWIGSSVLPQADKLQVGDDKYLKILMNVFAVCTYISSLSIAPWYNNPSYSLSMCTDMSNWQE